MVSTPISIVTPILPDPAGKVYHRIVNNKREKRRKILDKSIFFDIIASELHTSLIKSGGGNGPMKPGNLNNQGAKSGGNER